MIGNNRHVYSVLLVEKNAEQARAIQELLIQPVGVNAIVAHETDVNSALKRLAQTSFDAILLDISGTRSSGVESLRAIIGSVDRTAVIAMSDDDDPERIALVIKNGAQDCLNKSDINAGYLARSIGNSVERQRNVVERDALAEIGRIVSSTVNIGSVLDQLGYEIGRLVPLDRLEISKTEFDKSRIVDEFVWGVRIDGWDDKPSHPMLGARSVAALGSGRGGFATIHPGDGFTEFDAGQLSIEAGLMSGMFAPLISNGEVFGTLSVKSRTPDVYDESHFASLKMIADQVAGALRVADLYDQALMWAQDKEHRILLEAEKLELERVSRSKSEFIATVSHELKTPLTSINAFVDILSRNRSGTLDKKQLEQIEIIRRNGQRLDMLINDLLDISRIDSGRLALSLVPFDANHVITDLASSFEPIARGKSQTIEVAVPEIPTWIRADQARISQVVSNLLANASKYSGPERVIQLRVSVVSKTLQIEVVDSGIGIAEEDIANVFGPFFRADNIATRSVSGTGLGLTIAKTIIDLHAGEISVSSKYGSGTKVTITLPGIIDSQVAAEELAALNHPVVPRSRLEFIEIDSGWAA
ncbi:MAG: response regulator [Chloroflexi bacterium]|nr:response regulator [Chloroflexota bacterium]